MFENLIRETETELSQVVRKLVDLLEEHEPNSQEVRDYVEEQTKIYGDAFQGTADTIIEIKENSIFKSYKDE